MHLQIYRKSGHCFGDSIRCLHKTIPGRYIPKYSDFLEIHFPYFMLNYRLTLCWETDNVQSYCFLYEIDVNNIIYCINIVASCEGKTAQDPYIRVPLNYIYVV